jgi:hypothetical protein
MSSEIIKYGELAYLASNPDVAKAVKNGLIASGREHFERYGQKEGRKWISPRDQLESVMNDIKNQFDAYFYRTSYTELDLKSLSCLEHYCTIGWKEGRDPRFDFSTNTYLDLYYDVKEADINPFWHYVVYGKDEGRVTHHSGGYKVEILKRLLPLKKLIKLSKKNEKSPESLTVEQLEEIFKKYNYDLRSCVVISISHDNYKKNSGGIQLCIQIEQQLAIEQGWCYLNVHPWQPLPILAPEADDPDPLMSLILNGQFIGSCYLSVLTFFLKKINTTLGYSIYPIVHSLLGHSVNYVKEWISLNKSQKFWIWLHDFFTICPSYALMRNNLSFCNAPVIGSNACNICIYGDERSSHLERIRDLFTNVSAVVISPSEFTKKLWLSKVQNLNYEIRVLPHIELNWFSREKTHILTQEKPISVGFLGTKAYLKGWNIFEKLVDKLRKNSRFNFFYFGVEDSLIKDVHSLNVNVTSTEPFLMANAIAEMEIDFVLHWSICPEIFSLTTHEAIAGGAHILTNSISGNIAAVVSKTGMGTILSNEEELWTFFSQGKAEEIAITNRTINAIRGYRISFSEMTIPLLIEEHSL